MAYTQLFTLFDGSSANSSTFTSNPVSTVDFAQITVQYPTLVGASRITIQGTDEAGTTQSLQSWSNLTGIVAAGLYTLTPAVGMAWVRALRSSIDSQGIVMLAGKFER